MNKHNRIQGEDCVQVNRFRSLRSPRPLPTQRFIADRSKVVLLWGYIITVTDCQLSHSLLQSFVVFFQYPPPWPSAGKELIFLLPACLVLSSVQPYHSLSSFVIWEGCGKRLCWSHVVSFSSVYGSCSSSAQASMLSANSRSTANKFLFFKTFPKRHKKR